MDYKRVFKNTVSMYIRMIISTFISLYTVRVVLDVLGASDYGLYNVVGGIVGLFGFVSGSLINSAQRYFSFHLANEDWKKVSRVFSINIVIYCLLMAVILFLCETIGLWFLLNKMNIEAVRMTAAVCVYQLSVITFALGLIASPFQAILVSDENLKIYALISIFEGVLKLIIVYLISVMGGDKLILYAWLLLLSRVIINGFYMVYAHVHYKKLRYNFVKDKKAYAEVFSYTSWNFIGAIASVCKSQGVNIIINLFFGTTINAARGIAAQINSTLVQFSQNFMKAIEPQIIKSYAKKEENRFTMMMYFSSKISFFLIFIVGLPLIRDMQYVLRIWLKEVPDYTVVFTILIIIDTIIGCITDPILTAIQATGRIKLYQIIVGGINLLNLPFSYIFLRTANEPLIPFLVGIVVTIMMLIARIILAYKQVNLVIVEYIRKVLFPIFIVAIVALCINIFAIPEAVNFLALIRNVFLSLTITIPAIYFIGLSKLEKSILIQMIPWRRKEGREP